MIKQWIKQIQQIKQYRKAVQHGCYGKQYIFIKNDEDLRDISLFRLLDITSLCLQQCSGIQLNTVPKSLNGLSIKNCGLQNIDDLSNLNRLQHLDFSCNNIQRVDVLVKAINLKSLVLNENININLVQVGWLIQLNELRLDNIGLLDINFLVDLTNLTTLSMNQNKIQGISGISHLIKLQKLQLSENDISDLSPLRQLVQLHTLALNDNNIIDIDVLKNLTALNRLELDNNKIHNIWPLAGLSSWYILLLKNNKISELCPIYNKTSMFARLNISNNFITDLRPLFGRHYHQLSLENNYIMDITPLQKSYTDFLQLDNNYITKFHESEFEQIELNYYDSISVEEQKQPSRELLLLIRKRQIIKETFQKVKINESRQSKNEPKMRDLKLKMKMKVLQAQKEMINFSENLKMYFQEEQVSQ
ncbi:Conserved_hypothetical protein [Hexamita inflata]|uniref:Uncharacterized protein n=1 Tax=Hexamita inflata TaxID=28002 RepID=A0AA86TJP2_9EUKA|nr:Conserved hypothetical protein [Hexamita inflata]